MRLRFIGIDPETGQHGSPTIWVDLDNGELVCQGHKAGERLLVRCAETEIPGHATGILKGEAVIRIPVRMVPLLREACDVAERAELQRADGVGSKLRRAPGDAGRVRRGR